jgi:hypothetical protein
MSGTSHHLLCLEWSSGHSRFDFLPPNAIRRGTNHR